MPAARREAVGREAFLRPYLKGREMFGNLMGWLVAWVCAATTLALYWQPW